MIFCRPSPVLVPPRPFPVSVAKRICLFLACPFLPVFPITFRLSLFLYRLCSSHLPRSPFLLLLESLLVSVSVEIPVQILFITLYWIAVSSTFLNCFLHSFRQLFNRIPSVVIFCPNIISFQYRLLSMPCLSRILSLSFAAHSFSFRPFYS